MELEQLAEFRMEGLATFQSIELPIKMRRSA